jgi:hypothetical protein
MKVLFARTVAFVGSATILGTAIFIAPGCGGSGSGVGGLNANGGTATQAQVLKGRYLVTTHACADCHAQGVDDPNSATWLAGYTGAPGDPGTFQLGPFTANAANLTPDATTGLGNDTPLQIYNALKHGLDPADTPSVVITGDTPGVGNFPATPHFLAPIMPWANWRHMKDDELWAIVAYLKHGIKPVSNAVPAGTEPGDFWASASENGANGPVDLPAYPASGEVFNP